jgi:hypothetical protein
MVITDAAGKAEARFAAGRPAATFRVEAPGFPSIVSAETKLFPHEEVPIVLALPPLAGSAGVRASATPAAAPGLGATVIAVLRREEPVISVRPVALVLCRGTAVTAFEPDGHDVFRLDGVAPGPVTVVASGPGQEISVVELEIPSTARVVGIPVLFRRGRVLAGTVEEVSGESLRGAQLRLIPDRGHHAPLAVDLAPDGSFRMVAPPAKERYTAIVCFDDPKREPGLFVAIDALAPVESSPDGGLTLRLRVRRQTLTRVRRFEAPHAIEPVPLDIVDAQGVVVQRHDSFGRHTYFYGLAPGLYEAVLHHGSGPMRRAFAVDRNHCNEVVFELDR